MVAANVLRVCASSHLIQPNLFLVCYRLLDPGTEWRLHRQWFVGSAMADLLGSSFSLAQKPQALFDFLIRARSNVSFIPRSPGSLHLDFRSGGIYFAEIIGSEFDCSCAQVLV